VLTIRWKDLIERGFEREDKSGKARTLTTFSAGVIAAAMGKGEMVGVAWVRKRPVDSTGPKRRIPDYVGPRQGHTCKVVMHSGNMADSPIDTYIAGVTSTSGHDSYNLYSDRLPLRAAAASKVGRRLGRGRLISSSCSSYASSIRPKT
jgi:hypothetical protein